MSDILRSVILTVSRIDDLVQDLGSTIEPTLFSLHSLKYGGAKIRPDHEPIARRPLPGKEMDVLPAVLQRIHRISTACPSIVFSA